MAESQDPEEELNQMCIPKSMKPNFVLNWMLCGRDNGSLGNFAGWRRTGVLLLAMALAGVAVCPQAIAVQLVPLSSFGPHNDGTLRPGDVPFLTGDGSRFQRGMAYNPATRNLIIVNRYPKFYETINVIDGLTGQEVGALDVSSPAFGGNPDFVYNMVGVADDGAIYVGNLNTDNTLVTFNLYRWENETGSQKLVYSGDPRGQATTANGRWGDALAVRGSGMNTEVLISSRGTQAAILRPTDASMSAFTATTLNADVPTGAIGYTLSFGAGNTFWGKAASATGEALYHLSYDLNAGTATTLHVYTAAEFPGRIGALMVQPASNLLAAIEMTPGVEVDRVRLYDVANLASAPVLLDRKDVSVWTNANNIFTGAVAFGGTNVYALNSDNGVVALTMVPGVGTFAPVVFLSPSSRLAQIGSDVTLTVGADGTAPLGYQWLWNSNVLADATGPSLTLTNIQTTANGTYSVVVTNAYGSAVSAGAVLTVIPNYGNLVQFDPFAYEPGGALSGQGNWYLNSAQENGKIEAGNLSVPGLPPSVGNRYSFGPYNGAFNQSVRWLFSPAQTNGSIWFSFLLRIDEIGTSTANETMAGFAQGTSTAFPLKINIMGDGVGETYQIGIYKSSGTTDGAMAPQKFTTNDTVLVVARYTFRPGSTTNDTCDLWLNPPASTFGSLVAPTPTLADQGAGRTDLTFLDGFMWRVGTGSTSGYPKRTVDEWRLGYSWADVTATVPPVLSVARVGANVVLSWPADTSADFQLESATTLDDPNAWELASEPVVVQGTSNTVTVSDSANRRFFRLVK
jgi:hypothetical protein